MVVSPTSARSGAKVGAFANPARASLVSRLSTEASKQPSAKDPAQPTAPNSVSSAHPKTANKPSQDPAMPSPVFSTEALTSPTKAVADAAAKTHSPTLHPRYSKGWWWDWGVVFLVFAITGSTTMRVVKPLIAKLFAVEGSFIEGPWTYRLIYLATTLPLYSCILIAVGTLFGRGAYFRAVAYRMWGRLLPKRNK